MLKTTKVTKMSEPVWEKTDIGCWNCGDGFYVRNVSSKQIVCDNCHHAPDNSNDKPEYTREKQKRPRYANSGAVVMDGVFPELSDSMVVYPE